jgi:hypothetical protein
LRFETTHISLAEVLHIEEKDMKNIKTILAILTISLVFGGFTTAVSAKPSKASWTFMVYLDADNNLDPFGPINIQQMSSALTPRALCSFHKSLYFYYSSRMTSSRAQCVYSVK